MREDAIYLKHIHEAVERLEQYLTGVDKVKFLETPLIQDGVIRQIEIIGEATKRLSNDLRLAYPDIAWKDIAGMRDKLIHAYFGVNIEQVWLTAVNDVPILKKRVADILEEYQE